MNLFQATNSPFNFNMQPVIGRTTVPSFAEICQSAETSARRPIIDGTFLFNRR